MNGTLTLIRPGLCTLVVDAGRPRTRSLGVPVGGAADRRSLALGNALVDNPPDAPALEASVLGPTLRADVPLACVLFGAPFDLGTDQRELRAGRTFTLQAGETLSIGGCGRGLRAYLCVHGGLESPTILGSRSSLTPLAEGTQLGCRAATTPGRFLSSEVEDDAGPLRVLRGPQADWFDEQFFFAARYTVSPSSNRMGIRFQGPALAVPPRELISEPVCPGTVQVTREGLPIVLGVDGQTIGGYPRIAQVIAADLDRLGQLRPGQPVSFVPVSLAEASTLRQRRQAALREWLLRLSLSPHVCPVPSDF